MDVQHQRRKSTEYEVRSTKGRTQSTEYEGRSTKGGVRRAEYKGRRMKSGVWEQSARLRRAPYSVPVLRTPYFALRTLYSVPMTVHAYPSSPVPRL